MDSALRTREHVHGHKYGEIRRESLQTETRTSERVFPMRPSKYRNIRSGGRASKRENKRAQDLRLLEKLGEISDLEEQVKYELLPKQEGERAVTYTADFRYKDKEGKIHVEDSKGFKTQQYILRRKMMLYFHGIRIEEV